MSRYVKKRVVQQVFYGPPLPEVKNAAGRTFREEVRLRLTALEAEDRELQLVEQQLRSAREEIARQRDDQETAIRIYQETVP